MYRSAVLGPESRYQGLRDESRRKIKRNMKRVYDTWSDKEDVERDLRQEHITIFKPSRRSPGRFRMCAATRVTYRTYDGLTGELAMEKGQPGFHGARSPDCVEGEGFAFDTLEDGIVALHAEMQHLLQRRTQEGYILFDEGSSFFKWVYFELLGLRRVPGAHVVFPGFTKREIEVRWGVAQGDPEIFAGASSKLLAWLETRGISPAQPWDERDLDLYGAR